MKVLHTSDIHIDLIATRLGKFRLLNGQNLVYQERLERFKQIILEGVKESCDVFVVAGDLFNRTKPFPKEYADVCEVLDLVPEDKVVLIIPGNHDEITSRGCALLPLQDRRQNVVVALEPKLYPVKDRDFILAPWGTTINQINALRAISNKEKTVLVYHAGTAIEGLKWTEVEGEIGTVSVSSLQELNCSVMLGHYHGQVQIAPSIWYSGSPECFNFGERNQDKGFLIWDLDKKVTSRYTTKFPRYVCMTSEFFLDTPPNTRFDAFLLIQGDVSEEQRLAVLEKIKTVSFGEFDFKLDLKSKAKTQKVYSIKGRSNKEILSSYFESKKITTTEELIQLDAEVENKVAQS